MQELRYRLRLFFGTVVFFLLFVLLFLYIFTALALLSLGLIVFAGGVLGILNIVTVTTDLGLVVLAVLGLGMTLLGLGLCLGAVFLCKASYKRLCSFRKGSEWKKRRLKDE